jgi:hypothetical protein
MHGTLILDTFFLFDLQDPQSIGGQWEAVFICDESVWQLKPFYEGKDQYPTSIVHLILPRIRINGSDIWSLLGACVSWFHRAPSVIMVLAFDRSALPRYFVFNRYVSCFGTYRWWQFNQLMAVIFSHRILATSAAVCWVSERRARLWRDAQPVLP